MFVTSLKKLGLLKFTNSFQLSILSILIISIALIFLASISLGSFNFSLEEIFNSSSSSLDRIVLLEIRIPRVLLSAFVGASLGLSGASLQGLFRNPLADPGLIGVSAGAALGASLIIVLGSGYLPDFIFGTLILPISAIIGASLVTVSYTHLTLPTKA